MPELGSLSWLRGIGAREARSGAVVDASHQVLCHILEQLLVLPYGHVTIYLESRFPLELECGMRIREWRMFTEGSSGAVLVTLVFVTP